MTSRHTLMQNRRIAEELLAHVKARPKKRASQGPSGGAHAAEGQHLPHPFGLIRSHADALRCSSPVPCPFLPRRRRICSRLSSRHSKRTATDSCAPTPAPRPQESAHSLGVCLSDFVASLQS